MSVRAWVAVRLFGVWALVAFGLGAQAWVSLDTPDSEFHLTLSMFASQVTDRAAVPAYFWTRFGSLLPSHGLVSLFGPMAGLEIYRLLMLAIIIVTSYTLFRRFTTSFSATLGATLMATSTVVLGALGNPYPSSTVIAAAFSGAAICSYTSRPLLSGSAAGAVLAWAVMTNPYGATLVGVVCLSIAVVNFRPPRSLLKPMIVAVPAFLLVSVGFIAMGRIVFPGMDWLATVLFWNGALSQGDYIGDPARWSYDPSLLIVVVAVVVTVANAVIHRWSPLSRTAVAVTVPVTVWCIGYRLLIPNNYLEIPHYQVILISLALLGLVLSALEVAGEWKWTMPVLLVAAAAVAVSVVAGHSTVQLSTSGSRIVAAGCIVVLLVARRPWWVVMLAIGVGLGGTQVLANARDNAGVSTSGVYSNAYRVNETEAMVSEAAETQSWVIDRTAVGDRTLVWIHEIGKPEGEKLLPLAAFQLWGANEASKGPLIDDAVLRDWERRKPLSLVMYGPGTQSILDYWNQIPTALRPTIPECKTYPWPSTGQATTCVTRLTW